MTEIPVFKLYGDKNPEVEALIQPKLPLRQWDELTSDEKSIALQELVRCQWLTAHSREALWSVRDLNYHYLRILPGKRLHNVRSNDDVHPHRLYNETSELLAGNSDFRDIFVNGHPGELILRMLSSFASYHIDTSCLNTVRNAQDEESKKTLIGKAFRKFDQLASLLNRIFDQFCVNVMVTRNGFIPRQDEKIEKDIYVPTLLVLSDPKWKTVNASLADMFNDYQANNYPEVITKAHSVVQRFLQILVGEEGKSGKGELGKLFATAKKTHIVPNNRFTESIINSIQRFVVTERATNSTAKPALQRAESSDALLVMNVVMVFLQHCLQESKWY